ncbi:hypothetical protein B0H13DRAFT_1850483 [Mycena leptocephala]|nr:hypothetical protein B0H13DRAFT_1850483 [Mycena leptocephala]
MSYVSHLLSPLPSPHEGSFIDEGIGEENSKKILGMGKFREQGEGSIVTRAGFPRYMLLPTNPTFLPVIHLHLPRPRSRHRPLSSHPSAPPGSPIHTPSGHPTTAQTGIMQETSAACTKLMRVAQALERRTNAERRLRGRTRPRPPMAHVASAAAASTPPFVRDSSRRRAATPHLSGPSVPGSNDIIGALSDAPPSFPLPLPVAVPCNLRSYVDAATEPAPPPTSHDVAVEATPPDSSRSFTSAAVETSDASDDLNTTYGVISDPFARSLARLLPVDFERERKLTRAVYLDQWLPWAEWFASENLPPTQRVYLNTLAEIFRPWEDPLRGSSLAPNLNPVYNLFTHWWSGWNAIGFPGRPPERDPRLRYDFLTDPELHGEVPLSGRGFIVQHASWIVRMTVDAAEFQISATASEDEKFQNYLPGPTPTVLMSRKTTTFFVRVPVITRFMLRGVDSEFEDVCRTRVRIAYADVARTTYLSGIPSLDR